MKLVKCQTATGEVLVAQLDDEIVRPLSFDDSACSTLADIIESGNPSETAASLVSEQELALAEVTLLAPIDQQEVWAAGVTYKRSQTARMEESETSASCYDLVYEADRPELFMKATPHRVSGPGQPVRIRYDATWNVPEPEITCVVSSQGTLVGFTIGNDMSSRDIEGENPLYLPQAKVYRQCAGLGPCITLLDSMPAREDTGIKLQIERGGEVVFEGNSGVSEMHRTFEDLIGYLCREQEFPNGVFLMTGTGIVPDSDFTLNAGDVVHITICGIGTLTNPVVQG
ncbi:MAG: 2-hydroxyhepta-2,4-diene-1,7-dioate isomerase [Planctomycetaceae bacterium]|jgi:2-dehydro-3-deoxy-D-arabinonate dehydratase|nr:2-hydroxyhepta-2,4-diene-1,7-dioate isomerase [Planctomycetaceae bacterium]MDB4862070.1 fumarylacetoacetate hydrolase family protein [Pirellulaceae bacterium]